MLLCCCCWFCCVLGIQATNSLLRSICTCTCAHVQNTVKVMSKHPNPQSTAAKQCWNTTVTVIQMKDANPIPWGDVIFDSMPKLATVRFQNKHHVNNNPSWLSFWKALEPVQIIHIRRMYTLCSTGLSSDDAMRRRIFAVIGGQDMSR